MQTTFKIICGFLTLFFSFCVDKQTSVSNVSLDNGGSFAMGRYEQDFAPLPIAINCCNLNIDSIKKTVDSIPSYIFDGRLPYSSFKINKKCWGEILLEVVDGCSIPHLRILDTDSCNIIDERDIIIGLCTPEPGVHCKEYMIIREDFSIYVVDTITNLDLNDRGKEIKESTRRYLLFKKGFITTSGKIQLSDTIRRTLDK